MILSRYDLYKSSEIDGITIIPNGWDVRRIKDQGEYQSGNFISALDFEEENEYPVYGGNGLRGYSKNYNHNGPYILIGRQGALCGNINYASGKFWATEHAVVVYAKQTVNIKWFGELLKALNLNQYSLSAAQPGLSVDKIKRLLIPVPSFSEQTAIASYLDAKTSAIDRKISLLEQKIINYQQLRKSLINETVCRGLDKKVRLKDSGIEWIGMIPEHWEVKRFKSFALTIKGKNLDFSDFYFEKSLPNLSLEYLRNDEVTFPTYCYSSSKSLLVTEDDYIIVWDGAGVGEILNGKKGYLSSTIAKIVVNPRLVNPKYFFHLKDRVEYTLKQIPAGMGIPHLNPFVLNNLPCPYPPLAEQNAIATFLDEKVQKIDLIITNITTQIANLKELRKTLINDVVTGKLKVIE